MSGYALCLGSACIDLEEYEIELIIEGQLELGAPVAAVDCYFPPV